MMKIINSETEIYSFLSRLNTQKLNFWSWRLSSLKVNKIKIDKVTILSKHKEISLEYTSDESVDDFIADQDYINLFCPEQSILMRLKILKIKSLTSLRCSFPLALAIVDRRKKSREDFSSFETVKINIADFNINKKSLFDLAFDGLSFIITNEEKRYIVENKPVNIEFCVAELKFYLLGEVIYIKEIPRNHHENFLYGGLKVGIHFLKQDPNFLSWLEKIIR